MRWSSKLRRRFNCWVVSHPPPLPLIRCTEGLQPSSIINYIMEQETCVLPPTPVFLILQHKSSPRAKKKEKKTTAANRPNPNRRCERWRIEGMTSTEIADGLRLLRIHRTQRRTAGGKTTAAGAGRRVDGWGVRGGDGIYLLIGLQHYGPKRLIKSRIGPSYSVCAVSAWTRGGCTCRIRTRDFAASTEFQHWTDLSIYSSITM